MKTWLLPNFPPKMRLLQLVELATPATYLLSTFMLLDSMLIFKYGGALNQYKAV